MSRKLRILCLHGYRQSEVSFREKTGGLRKALKSLADFEFIRAPHSVHEEENSYSWFYSNPATHHILTYNCLDSSTEDPGFDDSVKYILHHISDNGPYDGVMAFSQGACLTSMLCTMKRTEPALSQLSFVMLFNGFRSRITKHDKYYTDLIDTVRSLHVYGETDEVIPLEMSEKLVSSFQNPIKFIHPGGHFVPSSAPVRKFCKEFLLEQIKLKHES
ncbi:hypothetical protein ACHWQZ_G018282 [Mnemiopsis leidyi]